MEAIGDLGHGGCDRTALSEGYETKSSLIDNETRGTVAVCVAEVAIQHLGVYYKQGDISPEVSEK